MSERIESFRDLNVYKKAFELQQEVFELTMRFPKEELYSHTVRTQSLSTVVSHLGSVIRHLSCVRLRQRKVNGLVLRSEKGVLLLHHRAPRIVSSNLTRILPIDNSSLPR